MGGRLLPSQATHQLAKPWKALPAHVPSGTPPGPAKLAVDPLGQGFSWGEREEG